MAGTGGVATEATSPEVRSQFPNTPATHPVRIRSEAYIATKVEINKRTYALRGGNLIAPGSYQADIDGRTMRLLT